MKFEFVKTNIQSTKGLQKSKYDVLLEEFKEPGDALEFDPAILSAPTAAIIAARFRKNTKKPFHSFVNTTSKKVTIRLRLDGELTSKEEGSESPETNEPE